MLPEPPPPPLPEGRPLLEGILLALLLFFLNLNHLWRKLGWAKN
jgi:hypothetical protein